MNTQPTPRLTWSKAITGPDDETLYEASAGNLNARIAVGADESIGPNGHRVVAALVPSDGGDPIEVTEKTFHHRDFAAKHVANSKVRLARLLRKEAERHAEATEAEERIARNYSGPVPAGWKLCTGELDNDRIKDSEGYHRDYPSGAHARIYKSERDGWLATAHHPRNGGWFGPFLSHEKCETLEDAITACDNAVACNDRELKADERALKALQAHVDKVRKTLKTSNVQHFVWEASEQLKRGVRS